MSHDTITVDLPEAFNPGWNKIPGIETDGTTLTIDPDTYFFRYETPGWLICGWDQVRDELLNGAESPDTAAEQQALEFVKAHGKPTADAAEVLRTAHEVYGYVFRDEHLADPDLSGVSPAQLRMLREAATLMALNRVELDGHISNVSPAWFFPVTTRVVYDLDDAESEQLDELYHGTFFNEPRRVESVRAHAALGGRLVHGCQSVPEMAGGCVVGYGTDIDRFRTELAEFKHEWIDVIRVRTMQH